MEQVLWHEQNTAENISPPPKYMIFDGFQTHQKKMKVKTETSKKYWLI
jgi:hypothetical protein